MVPDGVELVAVVEADRDQPHGTLGQALAVIAAGDADTLLLAELGAAAGSLDEVIWLLGWLRESGARLIALDVGLDTATDPGRATVGVLSEIDRLQRERGPHRPPRGRPGLGHARPELAERITELRARGLSLQAIARELNDAGIPTPRGGREWRASSVQAALGYRRPRPPAPGVPPPRPPGGRGPGKPGRRHGPPPPPPPHRPR
jgi:DNA invertase Pin-like site-specific DNA recombinase